MGNVGKAKLCKLIKYSQYIYLSKLWGQLDFMYINVFIYLESSCEVLSMCSRECTDILRHILVQLYKRGTECSATSYQNGTKYHWYTLICSDVGAEPLK